MLKAFRRGAASSTADVMLVVLPHLGILDSWLPILDEIKRRVSSLSISAVAPDPRRLARAQLEDFLLSRCDTLVDRVVTRIVGEQWSCFASFREAANYAREYNRRRHLGGPIEALYQRFPRLTATLDSNAPKAKAVLSDVSLLDRPKMEGLRRKSRQASWFSLPHGIDPRVPPLRVGTKSGTSGLDVTIYASSELEAAYYEESCGVPGSRIQVVGVPRHSQQWLGRLRTYYGGLSDDRKRFIFLASRPENKINFPTAKKLELLQGLRTLAERLECTVVVRLHPAETELDRAIIEGALGKDQMEVSWSYSTLPAMVGADGALFAVTMFSSVAVDMLAIGVPTIELFDFSDLALSHSLVTDSRGRLTSIYRRANLVLTANKAAELEAAAGWILADRDAVLGEQKAAYNRVYADPRNSVDRIVKDIFGSIGP